jgi:hypothetical protein
MRVQYGDVEGLSSRSTCGVASIERVNGGTRKLVNCEALAGICSRYGLFTFEAYEGPRLDVTRLSPAEVAVRIYDSWSGIWEGWIRLRKAVLELLRVVWILFYYAD